MLAVLTRSERVRGGVGVKQIVKQSVVVEVFRNGDLQQTLIGAPRAKSSRVSSRSTAAMMTKNTAASVT